MPLRELFIQIAALLKNLSPGKRITLVVIVAATIIGFIFLMTWTGNPDFQLLYSNLAAEDAGAIFLKLKEQKIPYQIASDGKSILIPSEKIYEIRLELASQGLPQGSGVGFEIFDKAKFGMTEFIQNINYQRALQGELSRTINGLIEVESSRVHIVLPEKSPFLGEEAPATASVVLKVRPGQRLGEEQIQGIVHLISSSISGLNPEKVTIVDNYCKMLAGLKKSATIGAATSDQLEYQTKVEEDLQNRIMTMLDSALGADKSIVRVSCSLDFKRHEKTEEMYQPDNQVTRSEQLLSESSSGVGTIATGIPGVASNTSAGETRGGGAGQNQAFQKQDRTVNYEIGKVTSHIIEPVGRITKISVAVIIDGTYKLSKGAEGAEAGEEWKYFPRTLEEMKKLENIVKRAVNFDAERGDEVEVVNIPFEEKRLKLTKVKEAIIEDGEEAPWYSDLKLYAPLMKHVFLGFFLFLSFIFVARPLVKWLTSVSVGDLEISKQLPMTVGDAEREYGKLGSSHKDQAAQMIAGNREQSMNLMKDWLKE
jgi:flagellar M-ring protein FliF